MVDIQKIVSSDSTKSLLPQSVSQLRKFSSRLMSFAVLQILIGAGFVVPYLLRYDEVINQSYMASTLDKHDLIRQQSGPRMIFVGGSSTAFGIYSPYIQEQLPYQPVNMGIHAGLGAEFMLNEVKPYVRSGDIVIISIEYESFIDFPPDIKQVFDSIEARKANKSFVPTSYLPALLDKGLVQVGSFLRRSATLISSDRLERLPYYTRAGFNEFGDMVAHYPLPDDTKKLATEGRYYHFKPDNIQRTIQAMNEFHELCQSKNVKVFYLYPPLMPTVLDMNQKEISKVEKALVDSLSFPILGTPEVVGGSNQDYFDTRYHLNQAGAKRHTQFLIEKISPHLNRN